MIMDEEIWRAYLDSLTEKELRSFARKLGFRIDGFRKDHQKTPRPVLISHFGKHPGVAAIMPSLLWLRKKIEEETENEVEAIEKQQQELFAEYGAVPIIAALASTEEDELVELGELWFDAWLEESEQQKEEAKDQKEESKLESQIVDLQAQMKQLEKKLKRAERDEKDWKSKYETLKTKNEKDRERWKKKTNSYDEKLAKKEEEVALWIEKCTQLEGQLAKMETEKAKLEHELNQSCLEILVVGTQERPGERKRIGSELVNLSYIDSNKQNGLSELVLDKDYILLQSARLSNPLRANLYTWCLRAGKQPLEFSGEEELMKKLERVLGAEK